MTSNELEIFKNSILDEVRVMMQTTGQVTQYIGARYVPLISDPIEWSSQKEYEPLTIVTNNGNSYTSRQFVPKNIPITNTQFWAATGNFNAQIEQYRKEVQAFDARITQAQNTANEKAPISHASESTEYGIGNSASYGHVKLSDNLSADDSNSGIAATPKMVSGVNTIIKNLRIYNPVDYKLASDPDFTNAFKKIATLVNSSETASHISIPIGEYVISDTIIFTSPNVTISGQNDYVGCRINYTGENTAFVFKGTGVRIYNVSFVGNETKLSTCIDVQTTTDCDAGFEHVYFQFFKTALQARGRNLKCDSCTFDNCIYGIKQLKPTDNVYRVTHIYNCRFHAMRVDVANNVADCAICIDIECDKNYSNNSRSFFDVSNNVCDTASNCVFLKCPDICMTIANNSFVCNNIAYFIYMPQAYAAGKSIPNSIIGNNNVNFTNLICYFLYMESNTPTIIASNVSNNGAMYIKAINRCNISANTLMLSSTYSFTEYLKVDSFPSVENVISANTFIKATTVNVKNSNNSGVTTLMKGTSNHTSFAD